MRLDRREEALEHVCYKLLEMLRRRLFAHGFPLRIACQEVVHDQQRRDEIILSPSSWTSHGLDNIFAKTVVLDSEMEGWTARRSAQPEVGVS